MNYPDLSLEVSKNNNPKVIRIYDTSHYTSDEVVDNYLLEVLPANKAQWLTFQVVKGFSLVLNSSSLKYNRAGNQAELVELPDGIFEIKQSFSPNLQTISQFCHFRVTILSNKILHLQSRLYSEQCKLSHEEFRQNRDSLRDMKEYLDAAVWMVEECGEKKKGKEIYEFVQELIQRYTKHCRCQ